MKKVLFTIFCLLLFVIHVMAQSSMTDSQVIDFVMKEQKAGSSQSQIVTKLMQKGVDIQQIRRIKNQYEHQIKGSGLGVIADEAFSKADARMRQNNGESKDTSKKNGIGTTSGKLKNGSTYEHSYDYSDEEFVMMNRAIGELYGDSLISDKELDEYYNSKNRQKVFGRDIFNNKKLTFEPNMNIATPQNYCLGPGDAVFIDIYGASQKTVQETISPDGTVTIDGYGPVYLSGLTVDQANAKLRSTLGSRYASSSVKLTVGQTRTIMVNVMGEVKTPGTYTLSAFATVFHALYMAGGISDIGSLRDIKVYRQGRLVTQVDVYDYILNGQLTGNISLVDNDVIIVSPYDCLVNVSGKVKRPMFYEMKKTESIQTLLKYAGGFANDAYKQSVRVIRKTGHQYAVFNVAEFDMSSFNVCDGDSVGVDSIMPRFENMVEVKGAVFRPGLYNIGGEVTSVRPLLKMCEGVTEEAFTKHAVIHRLKPDRTLEIIAIDIEGIMNGSVADVPLANEDVLFIPTKQIVLEEQTITIHGEVQFPGLYKYADNETIEDFILQAGGLKESASVMKVDVARRHFDPKAVTTEKSIAKTFSFQIKDGFVIDGQSDFVLQPFDEVYVRKNPNYTKQQNVFVEGEVNFSGTYTLEQRETRLSDIIKAAGGLNAEAYVMGAALIRQITRDERLRMESMMKMAKKTANANDSISIQKLEVGDTYNVGIQLDKALASPGSSYDIILREGDHLVIPKYNGTVKINGSVMYPNTIAYREGKSASWYVNRAGGYSNTAKKSKSYIVYPNGMVERIRYNTKVTPGSEIVVPEKIKKEHNTQGTALIVSAISALATVGAVLVSAFK